MLNSKVYDVLKYLTIIVLPAIGALYTGLAQIWSLPYFFFNDTATTEIYTFLGGILCISTAQYNKHGGMNIDYSADQYWDDEDDEDVKIWPKEEGDKA